MDDPQVIVIGASVRAAAFSALRAGLRPWCVDLFRDEDLQRMFPVRRIASARYPRGFARALADAPNVPWLYTGGLENHPTLVERLTRERPLWGNRASVLRRVRDPEELATCLAKHDLPCPRLLPQGSAVPAEGRWLRKPRRGSAGLGIETVNVGANQGAGKQHYLQEHIDGQPLAAVYLGDGAGARLLGVSRQLVGEPWLYAGPFRYCGSIGPIRLPQPAHAVVERIGTVLAREFGLRGLFGVDLVLRDGVPYPVEVNPRYTASVEALEFAAEVPALALHRGVFAGGVEVAPPIEYGRIEGAIIGKAILFAPAAFAFPDAGPWVRTLHANLDPWRLPEFADIPRAGSSLAQGHPVLTVFATGKDERDCLERLKVRARATYACFFPV